MGIAWHITRFSSYLFNQMGLDAAASHRLLQGYPKMFILKFTWQVDVTGWI
jgi:hypothetical protein